MRFLILSVIVVSIACNSQRNITGVYIHPNTKWGRSFTFNKDLTFFSTARYRGHPDSEYVDISKGNFYFKKDTIALSYDTSAFITLLLSDSSMIIQPGLYKPLKLLRKRKKLLYETSDLKGEFYPDMDLIKKGKE